MREVGIAVAKLHLGGQIATAQVDVVARSRRERELGSVGRPLAQQVDEAARRYCAVDHLKPAGKVDPEATVFGIEVRGAE